MTYPMPNALNMSDFFAYPNTVTSGLFWPGIIFAFFLIAFMSMRVGTKNGVEAFMGSSFITLLVSIPLSALGYINPFISVMFLVFTAMGIMIKGNEGS